MTTIFGSSDRNFVYSFYGLKKFLALLLGIELIFGSLADYLVKFDITFRAIYYASKTFYEAQENYSTIEKEILARVFACEKLRPYISDGKERCIAKTNQIGLIAARI